jgi:hypothetical protein
LAGPQDYMVGGAPQPASYAGNPQMGFQVDDRIADLPKRYEQGQQYAVAQALRTAFPNGLPQLPNRQLDANDHQPRHSIADYNEALKINRRLATWSGEATESRWAAKSTSRPQPR